MSTDMLVGLLTLSGMVYLAWVQRDVRRAERNSNDAEAMSHMTTSLLQALEAIDQREKIICDLREQLAKREAEIDQLEAKIATLMNDPYGLVN